MIFVRYVRIQQQLFTHLPNDCSAWEDGHDWIASPHSDLLVCACGASAQIVNREGTTVPL